MYTNDYVHIEEDQDQVFGSDLDNKYGNVCMKFFTLQPDYVKETIKHGFIQGGNQGCGGICAGN